LGYGCFDDLEKFENFAIWFPIIYIITCVCILQEHCYIYVYIDHMKSINASEIRKYTLNIINRHMYVRKKLLVYY